MHPLQKHLTTIHRLYTIYTQLAFCTFNLVINSFDKLYLLVIYIYYKIVLSQFQGSSDKKENPSLRMSFY